MHRQTQSTVNLGRKRLSFLALVLCVCFILVSMSSAAFIVNHTNHVHDHDGLDGSCVMCAHISAAENLLEQLCAMATVSAMAAMCILMYRAAIQTGDTGARFCGLVGLKVKLNN